MIDIAQEEEFSDEERLRIQKALKFDILHKRYTKGIPTAVLSMMVMNAECFHDTSLFASSLAVSKWPAAVQIINQHQRPLLGMVLLCN